MSQFAFLQQEWAAVFEAASRAEGAVRDFAPHGPDGLFKPADIDVLIGALDAVRATAVAA